MKLEMNEGIQTRVIETGVSFEVRRNDGSEWYFRKFRLLWNKNVHMVLCFNKKGIINLYKPVKTFLCK